MKRNHLNFLVDTVAFAGFALLTTTGVLMRYLLPPGSGHHATMGSLDRHQWGGIHFWTAVVFFSVLVLHLLLHWRWIVAVVRGRPRVGSGIRVGLGLVGLTVLLILTVIPLTLPVQIEESVRSGVLGEAPGTDEDHHERSLELESLSSHRFEGLEIHGRLTLEDLHERYGVPTAILIHGLGLPNDVDTGKRLGPLKREYGFEMDRVRVIVQRHLEDS